MKRVDYVKNAVEEKIGRPISNDEYKKACETAGKYHWQNMEGKILLISIIAGGEKYGKVETDI